MLTTYDLGDSLVAENLTKLNINELAANVMKKLKIKLLHAQIEAFDEHINTTTTKTSFNGYRIWFVCPTCKGRVAIVYKHPLVEKVGCRLCFNVTYLKQRYKGMTESNIIKEGF